MAFIGKLFISPDTFEKSVGKCGDVFMELQACNFTACSASGPGCNLTACGDAIRDLNGTAGSSCLDDLADGGKLAEGGYGVVQLVFLMACYGLVLKEAAGLIGDGAELLLLVPSMATLVGTLVLPILGAVPDGAIVLFSGMGPDAQNQLSVGMGALAGSTIMLLTIPWFLAVFAGRVDMSGGECKYKKPKGVAKLTGTGLLAGGVETGPAVGSSCLIMLVSSITYIIIQAPAMSSAKLIPQDGDHGQIQHERTYALIGLIVSSFLFLAVLVYQVKTAGGESEQEVIDAKVAEQKKSAIDSGMMNFTSLFQQELNQLAGAPETPGGSLDTALVNATTSKSGESMRAVRSFLKPYFNKYDVDKSGDMDVHEIRQLFKDLGESVSLEEIKRVILTYDSDKSGDISFDEFISMMVGFAEKGSLAAQGRGGGGGGARSGLVGSINNPASLESGGNEEEGEGSSSEEEDEMPEDLAELSPEEQQKAIIKRSLWQMSLGTILCLLFSDPMVDCLGALGDRTGIPPFYVSFVLAPLASNGTELLAAYNFALKKTKKSITVSLSQLEGAAIMNNTFCLAIFLFLIYVQNLEWAYTAETVAILLVQLMVGAFARKKYCTMVDAWIILALYPVSLVLVMVLESAIGLD